MMLTANGEGVAGLWLMANAPVEGSREDQVKLGAVFDDVYLSGIKQGLTLALEELIRSPTHSAAVAMIEADLTHITKQLGDRDPLK